MGSGDHASAVSTLTADLVWIIDHIHAGIPYGFGKLQNQLGSSLASHLNDKANREKAEALIRDTIENHSDDLLRSAGTEIVVYLNAFSIRSNSADPIKLIYWYGRALADRVGGIDPFARRCVLLVTYELLDVSCRNLCKGKTMPAVMREKLSTAVIQDKEEVWFGTYGAYHAFKTFIKHHEGA